MSGDFRYSYDLFLDDGDFYSSVNDFLDLFDHNNRVVNNFLNFFYPISVHDFLLDDFNFLDGRYFNLDLDNLFNSLRYFNYLFDGLDDSNWLFNDNFNDFRHVDDLVDCLFSTSPLNNLNYFFNYAVERLNDFDNLLNDFLLDDFDFNNFSDDLFNCHDLLLDNLNFFDLNNSVVDDLLNDNWFFNFNYLLSDHFDFNDLGDLDYSFDDLFNDSWDFNYLFSVLRYLNNFFNDVVDDFNDFNWNMDDFLDLLDLDNLD